MNLAPNLFFLCSTLILVSPLPLQASEAYQGKWFRITGQWDGTRLVSDRTDWREAGSNEKYGQISGLIDQIDIAGKKIIIGPVTVSWTDQTKFQNIDPLKLKPRDHVRINIDNSEPGIYRARSIEPRLSHVEPGAIQLTAPAKETTELPGGEISMNMLGVPVYLPQAGYNRAKSPTRRQDSRRPDKQFQTTLAGRPLTLGGEYTLAMQQRNNFDLDDQDDRIDLDQEFSLELFYPFNSRTALFAELKGFDENELRDVTGTRQHDSALARGQLWLYWGSGNYGLQIGRQNLAEVREWWWDEDLDAIRLYYDRGPWHMEAGVAQELARETTLENHIDPEQNKLMRIFGQLGLMWAPKQKIDLFALHQNDRSSTETIGQTIQEDREDTSDARLTWIGLRALGERSLDTGGELRYWLDTAIVSGKEDLLDYTDVAPGLIQVASRQNQKVRGHAIDVGASLATRLPGKPAFTVGYARGSGDGNNADGVDHSFRQTGLQENKWRFSGVNRFRYYGELMRPEPSNIGITTLAVGFPLLTNSSVELLHHYYQQTKANTELRDVAIDASLTGLSRDLGHEVDLVFGFREWRRWDLEFIASTFKAGEAYGIAEGKRAYRLAFEATFNF